MNPTPYNDFTQRNVPQRNMFPYQPQAQVTSPTPNLAANWDWNYRNQNPYMQNSVMTPSSIPGRFVENPTMIRPNEVPLDGSVSLFPLSDYSCIYAKAWGSDGSIQTVRYIPEKVDPPTQGPSEFDRVMERLTAIEQLLVQNQNGDRSGRRQQQNNPNSKKEGSDA